MHRVVAALALGLVACVEIDFVAMGGGGAGGAPATGGSSAGGSGTGGGPPACAEDPDCDDANPCTLDACLAGSCEHASVAEGQPGLGDGCPGSGLCQSDGACGLSLWEKPFSPPEAPWTRVPLSSIWQGAGAPPPRGISAVDLSFDGRLLLVFADDGFVYRRLDNAWLDVVSAEELFSPPTMGATPPDPAQLASATMWRQTAAGPDKLLLTMPDPSGIGQLAYDFDFDVDQPDAFAAQLYAEPITASADPDAPPQATVAASWALAHQVDFEGAPNWIYFFSQYGAKTYRLNGASFAWASYRSLQLLPFWGPTNLGPPGGVVAAFKHQANGTVSFIAP